MLVQNTSNHILYNYSPELSKYLDKNNNTKLTHIYNKFNYSGNDLIVESRKKQYCKIDLTPSDMSLISGTMSQNSQLTLSFTTNKLNNLVRTDGQPIDPNFVPTMTVSIRSTISLLESTLRKTLFTEKSTTNYNTFYTQTELITNLDNNTFTTKVAPNLHYSHIFIIVEQEEQGQNQGQNQDKDLLVSNINFTLNNTNRFNLSGFESNLLLNTYNFSSSYKNIYLVPVISKNNYGPNSNSYINDERVDNSTIKLTFNKLINNAKVHYVFMGHVQLIRDGPCIMVRHD